MVLEGLPVDVEDELTHLALFLVKVDSGFYTIDLVTEGHREDRSNGIERDVSFVELGLVEGNVDGLTLSQVLGNQRVLHSFHEEVEGVGSDQTSSRLGLDDLSIKLLGGDK